MSPSVFLVILRFWNQFWSMWTCGVPLGAYPKYEPSLMEAVKNNDHIIQSMIIYMD